MVHLRRIVTRPIIPHFTNEIFTMAWSNTEPKLMPSEYIHRSPHPQPFLHYQVHIPHTLSSIYTTPTHIQNPNIPPHLTTPPSPPSPPNQPNSPYTPPQPQTPRVSPSQPQTGSAPPPYSKTRLRSLWRASGSQSGLGSLRAAAGARPDATRWGC